MKLEFYNNKSSNNTINKDLTLLGNTEINFFIPYQEINTSIVLSKNVLPAETNYLKIDDRYYIILEKENTNYNQEKIYLKLDVLETYKDIILKSHAMRIQSNNSKMLQSLNRNYTYKIDRYIFSTLDKNARTYFLVTLGG